eukprot:TRINITY_DN1957_c0_g1_i2.p1 TRINITY_DN1957_c0_g1~~TRINITY_DN1957_c0_g1_i2.p1  ORF type:complete len:343 (-),score=87.63 TRINITY_DN1957_c0_g1_i2:464-1492(-)
MDIVTEEVDQFVTKLKRRHVQGSFDVTIKTFILMRDVISNARWNNAKAIMDIVRDIGRKLVAAQPLELAIGNVVRQVLYIIRHEHVVLKLRGALEETRAKDGNTQIVQDALDTMLGPESLSTANLLGTVTGTSQIDYSEQLNLKPAVMDHLLDIIHDTKTVHEDISKQAPQHIHSNEVILTFNVSTTVVQFLKNAARKRKFEVIVAETAPSYVGHEVAKLLSADNIQTTVIADSAVFAIMSRVSKVIVGTHAVVADGGIISHSGGHLVALAAKHHSVPFIVLTGLYKLSPLHAYEYDTFGDLGAPSAVLNFEGADYLDNVNVVNPTYDYVPPNLISLFITNA